jgi:hypothetical protein
MISARRLNLVQVSSAQRAPLTAGLVCGWRTRSNGVFGSGGLATGFWGALCSGAALHYTDE